jgi:nucleoside-diphosphate-sugar epimerase
MDYLAGKRFVIFGCGYVGSALARAAAERGAQVTALTRNAEKAVGLRAQGVHEVVLADLATDAWHERIAPGPEFVVNCVSSGGGGLEGYRRSYVEGMRSILAWAGGTAKPVGTFIYTSSTSVYTRGGGAVVDETSVPLAAVAGGGALVEAENLLRTAPALARQRWFILRLAGLYGPGRHALLDRLRENVEVLVGAGSHHLNLVHRDDVVAAILACCGAPPDTADEIFNVADGAPATKTELVAWLAARLGRRPPRFDGVQPASARRGGEPGPDRIIGNAKLRRLLGWRPKYPTFRDGYAEILRD